MVCVNTRRSSNPRFVQEKLGLFMAYPDVYFRADASPHYLIISKYDCTEEYSLDTIRTLIQYNLYFQLSICFLT